ncbi:hypothetical protein Trydic_g21500 [Trypoxylus dichotomus]
MFTGAIHFSILLTVAYGHGNSVLFRIYRLIPSISNLFTDVNYKLHCNYISYYSASLLYKFQVLTFTRGLFGRFNANVSTQKPAITTQGKAGESVAALD